MKTAYLFCLFAFTTPVVLAQPNGGYLPKSITPNTQYLFYLHGGIVQQQGADAVSPYFGPYKYLDILDSLRNKGFKVISEIRPKESEETTYAKKVAAQVDSLLSLGVKPHNITLVGASLGAYITLESALMVKNSNINYAILGLCSTYAIEYYSDAREQLIGNFLSIYERTDDKGSCKELFVNKSEHASFNEIQLNMGNGHGFLFQPYPEWTEPLSEWIRSTKRKNK